MNDLSEDYRVDDGLDEKEIIPDYSK